MYTVKAISAWTAPQYFTCQTLQEVKALRAELRDQQYLVEVESDAIPPAQFDNNLPIIQAN